MPKESFRYILDKWAAEIPADEPAIPGQLCNRIDGYPESTGLRCSVHLRSDLRPRIVLDPTEHPLAVEQREGITLERVKQIFAEPATDKQKGPATGRPFLTLRLRYATKLELLELVTLHDARSGWRA